MATQTETPTALGLEHVFSYHADLAPPVAIGGPYGQRTYFQVTGGTVEGPRLSGTLVGGGGDWALVDEKGIARLDVRGQIETDDGVVVYMSYLGVLHMSEAVQGALGGGSPTEFDAEYFRTTPRFETGDERYAWLTESVFVAEGRAHPGPGVEYRVYRVM